MMNKKLSLLAAAAFAGITSIVAAQDVQTGATEKTDISTACASVETNEKFIECIGAIEKKNEEYLPQIGRIYNQDESLQKSNFREEILIALRFDDCAFLEAGFGVHIEKILRPLDAASKPPVFVDLKKAVEAYSMNGAACRANIANVLERYAPMKDLAKSYRELSQTTKALAGKGPKIQP